MIFENDSFDFGGKYIAGGLRENDSSVFGGKSISDGLRGIHECCQKTKIELNNMSRQSLNATPATPSLSPQTPRILLRVIDGKAILGIRNRCFGSILLLCR